MSETTTQTLNEQMWQVKTETADTLYPPTTEEQIYDGDYELVLGRLKYYLHNEIPVPLDTIKQFYRRFSSEVIRDTAHNIYIEPDINSVESNFESSNDDPDDSWKQAASKFLDNVNSQYDKSEPIGPNIDDKLAETIPHTIKSESWGKLNYYSHDMWSGRKSVNNNPQPLDVDLSLYQYDEGKDDFRYDYDPSIIYLCQACSSLPDQSKAEIIEMYLDQINSPESQKLIFYEPLSKSIHFLIKEINQTQLKADLWAKVISNYLKSPDPDDLDFLYMKLTDEQGMLSSISSDKLNETEVEQFITTYILYASGNSDYTFASILNAIRKAVENSDIQTLPHFNRLKKIMHRLLGTSEDKPLHMNLESVYQSINFDAYPKNQEAQIQEEDILRQTFNKGQGTIVSLAQGTGRFLELYKKLGYSNIIGIDISSTNLQTASEKPISQDPSVNLIQGDWEKIPLANESVDALECIGRNLPHVENPYRLDRVIEELNRICKSDATIIIDFPNPNVGQYEQAIESTRSRLREFNLPEDHIQETWSIVDSPDGQNYYNRLTPPPEDIIKSFELKGFELISQNTKPIPNMPEDQNIYFVFKKKYDLKKDYKKMIEAHDSTYTLQESQSEQLQD